MFMTTRSAPELALALALLSYTAWAAPADHKSTIITPLMEQPLASRAAPVASVVTVEYAPGATVRIGVRLLGRDYQPAARGKVTLTIKKGADPKSAEEDILKSLPPAARALVEATRSQAAVIEKRAGEIERAERIAKAKEDGIQKPDEIADLISKIAKGVAGQAEADAVYAILKGNSAALRDAALFRPVGSSGATATTGAMGEIATRVAKLRSEKPTMSEAVAMDAVLSADPGLYQRYRQENITGIAR